MLKAALDEATATIPSQVQSQPVAIEKKQESHDLFVSYWIRGVCADGLRTIHAQTGCAALKQDLGTILSLPALQEGSPAQRARRAIRAKDRSFSPTKTPHSGRSLFDPIRSN